MRREIPLMLVFLAGVVMAVQFFVPSEFSGNIKDFMSDWLIIIGIFAMALGLYSLVRVSLVRIRRRLPNWQYSVITIAGLFVMILFGTEFPGLKYEPTIPTNDAVETLDSCRAVLARSAAALSTEDSSGAVATIVEFSDSCATTANYILAEKWVLKTEEQEAALQAVVAACGQLKAEAQSLSATPDSATLALVGATLAAHLTTINSRIGGIGALNDRQPIIGGQASYMFRSFFNYIMIPIQATMFSLLAFFIASAAYRAFRARSILATVLLLAALVLMGRLIPLGPVTDFLNDLSSWILLTPNLAAKRAILIGVGLGMVATALKVVLGIERSYLGRD